MRAPTDTISAPPLPAMKWVNVAMLRMDQQVGRPVLIEFWDFCRVNSLRTLPYVKAWHERYSEAGLRVIGVHAPGFRPSRKPDNVREAVARLGIEYAVALDGDLRMWQTYEVPGWPARYLFDQKLKLVEYHHGEGDYAGTERVIQELLGVEGPTVPPLRPQDAPGAQLLAPTPDQAGAYSGPYAAGAAWAVVSGTGTLVADGREHVVEHPGAVLLAEHAVHTEATLALSASKGVTVHATCFEAGLAPDDVPASPLVPA